jgi:hypothetical protein
VLLELQIYFLKEWVFEVGRVKMGVGSRGFGGKKLS